MSGAFDSSKPRILVVDHSKVTRRLICKTVGDSLPEAEVLDCGSGEEARKICEEGVIDLVTTSLSLPDMDGMSLARDVREQSPQRYIPIIVISGEVQDRLERRDFSDDVTDYFDKSLGFKALGAFVKNYVMPDTSVTGKVLYVEDSRVVALATRRMMENNGLEVDHTVTVEEALEILKSDLEKGTQTELDLILTDVYLKGGLTGKELLQEVRDTIGLTRRQMPILVMTGDDNRKNQTELLRAGANDLVEKPIDEKLLINKLRFQLQLARGVQ